MDIRDIDLVIAKVERIDSNIRSIQRQVKYAADDDGIWFSGSRAWQERNK
jgi:hypothetical protein